MPPSCLPAFGSAYGDQGCELQQNYNPYSLVLLLSFPHSMLDVSAMADSVFDVQIIKLAALLAPSNDWGGRLN